MEKAHKIIRIKAGNTTYAVPQVLAKGINKNIEPISNKLLKDIYEQVNAFDEIDKIEEDKFEDRYAKEIEKITQQSKQLKKQSIKEPLTKIEVKETDTVYYDKDKQPKFESHVREISIQEGKAEQKFHKKPKPTHFLHIPINSSKSFQKKLDVFYKKIEDLDPSLTNHIYDKQKHFTFMVLNLDSDQEMLVSTILQEIAMEIVKIFSIDKYTKNKGYTITLSGLECFKDRNNGKPRVIFAELNDPKFKKKLDNAAHFLIKTFIDMGLMDIKDQTGIEYDAKEATYKVSNWHLTLLKTKYGFDDFGLMKQYKDFNFGQVEVDKLVLSKMDKNHTPVCEIDI